MTSEHDTTIKLEQVVNLAGWARKMKKVSI